LKLFTTCFAAASAITLLAISAPPASATPTVNASTVISASPSNPVPPSAGADVTISTLTSSTLGQPYIDQGKISIQIATNGAGLPVPALNAVNWVTVLLNQSPSAGVVSFPIDLENLTALNSSLLNMTGGMTAGFRAHYVTGGGQTHADTHFSDQIDVTLGYASLCSGVTIGATRTDGNGAPTPGSVGPWKFTIHTSNCSGSNLTGVKIQGGTNGWGTLTGATYNLAPTSFVVKNNKNNEVITWTGNLANGQSVDIEVTMDGSIKPNATCSPDANFPVPGSIVGLSGEWSASYVLGGVSYKAGYTGKVSMTVVCTQQ
jgi:hypothetical protein